MATNPNISLEVEPLDVMKIVQGSLESGESIRQMGVRDAILKQQQQIGQFNLEQAKQQKALQGMQQFGSVVEGLSSIPDLAQRAKVLAQQIPMLEEIGIPASRLSSLDLSNEGLKSVQMQLRPFMEQKEKEVANQTGVGDISLKDFTSDSVQEWIDGGKTDFSVLERVEKWRDSTLPDGTKVQVNSETGELRYPTRVSKEGDKEELGRDVQLTELQQAKSDLTRATGAAETEVLKERIEELTQAEINKEIELLQARSEAQAIVDQRIKEQGQMGKVEDAMTAYKALKSGDLDKIYGRGESIFPDFLRSQEGINMQSFRDQLLGMLTMAARGELQGQGTISDGEVKTIEQAATILSNENISPDLARQQLDAAMKIISKNAGIDFNPDTSVDEDIDAWLDQELSN